MALFANGGGLFGNEPAGDEKQPTLTDLEKELAVLKERNARLEEQAKIQRDSFLQLNQHSSEQNRLLREQLAQQVNRAHPGTLPSAPVNPPSSDKWDDLVNSLTGQQPQAPAQQPQAASISPEVLQQAVRQTIQEEERKASQAQEFEKQELARLGQELAIKAPELMQNKQFIAEADRVYAQLRSTGLPVHNAWNMAIREASHITQNYSQRRKQQNQQEAQQQQSQKSNGAPYLTPFGFGAAQNIDQQRANSLNIDMRPDPERFKDAAEELSKSRQELALRQLGFPIR